MVVMNIFEGINNKDIELLTNCLQAVKKTYKKNEIIFDIGNNVTSVAYIIDGCVQLSKDDYEGNKIIIKHLTKADTFAESMVFAGTSKSLICAKAIEDTTVLFLNFKRILYTCSNSCPFHRRLIENIIKIISLKNLMLQERIELLSKKTIKERILNMLLKEKLKSDKEIFQIPYSREQMAEFTGVDRSALSRTLSKMKTDGIIDYHKNMFKIL